MTPVASSIRMNDPVLRSCSRVAEQRDGRAQLRPAELVQTELLGLLVRCRVFTSRRY